MSCEAAPAYSPDADLKGSRPMAILFFKKIKNIRDFSGIHTRSGKVIHNRRVLRSDSLNKATDKDLEHLRRLGVNLILDLRTAQEAEEKPNVPVPFAEVLSIPVVDSMTAGITRESGATIHSLSKNADNRADLRSKVPDLTELYPKVAMDRNSQIRFGEAVRKVMEWAVDEKGTVLFHCTAGKDRTGILALILLEILDVPRSAIYHDYMLTNLYANHDSRKYYILALLFKFDRKLARRAYYALRCERRYLDAFYAAVEKEYGSVLDFIRNALGIPDDLIARFREVMLKNVPATHI